MFRKILLFIFLIHLCAANASSVGPFQSVSEFQKTQGITEIMLAVRNNNLDWLTDAIKRNPQDINAQDNRGETALLMACNNQNTDIIRQLLANHAEPNIPNHDGRYPLHIAANRGNIEILQLLLHAKANIDSQDVDGRTPLIEAIQFKHEKNFIQIVKQLIQAKANVNLQTKHRTTALMCAVNAGNIEVIRLLLQSGADVNIQDILGRTAWMHGVQEWERPYGLFTSVDDNILNEFKDSNINPYILVNEYTPAFHWACSAMDTPTLCQFFLNYGFWIDSKSPTGETPLMYAVRQENIPAIKFLLKKGANINAQDSLGGTVLAHAIHNPEILKFLLTHHAEVNTKNDRGFTPLEYAMMQGTPESIKMLLYAGANPNLSTFPLASPLHLAILNRNFENALTLLNYSKTLTRKIFVSLKAAINTVELYHQLRWHKTSEFAVHLYPNFLMTAIAANNLSLVKTLVKLGIDTKTSELFTTPVHFAAFLNHEDIVLALFLNNPNLNLKDEHGNTVLEYAAAWGNIKLVQNLTHKNKMSQQVLNNALLYAANQESRILLEQRRKNLTHQLFSRYEEPTTTSTNYVAVVGKLLSLGADINTRAPETGNTPIFEAVNFYDPTNIPTVKKLIEAGANVNLQNNSGKTPLSLVQEQIHIAEKSSDIKKQKLYLEYNKLLIQAGAIR